MIDLSKEKLITLYEAAELIPASRGAKKTHFTTVLRWIDKGSRALDGSIVRLEAIRLGGKWMTSIEAMNRYAERLTQ